MGSGVSKQREHEVMREKWRYLHMSLENKRRDYTRPHTPIPAIPKWPDHYRDKIASKTTEVNRRNARNIDDVINAKVSLYHGDITELEVDVIVNSASQSIFKSAKGQVNNAICNAAGDLYRDECVVAGLRRLTPGEVIITGDVVNTIAPRRKTDLNCLGKCYTNSLDIARREKLCTIAFPCIAVKKRDGVPHEQAAMTALQAVREWLEKHRDAMERVIFCVFETEDLVHYNRLMQQYFPVSNSTASGSHHNVDSAAHEAAGGAVSYTGSVGQQQLQMDKKAEILQTKQKFIDMNLQQKRHQYRTREYVKVHDIRTWHTYYNKQLRHEQAPGKTTHAVNDTFNKIVALYMGDITELELDAIVNSAARRTDGGLVNIAVLEAAGDTYREECELYVYGKVPPGSAKITGGYRLPATYMVNTIAPKMSQGDVLEACYINSLEAARAERLRSLAFPCIATHKSHRIENNKAADIALASTRRWLESSSSSDSVLEMIVFCVYTPEDLRIYEELMPFYFPVDKR